STASSRRATTSPEKQRLPEFRLEIRPPLRTANATTNTVRTLTSIHTMAGTRLRFPCSRKRFPSASSHPPRDRPRQGPGHPPPDIHGQIAGRQLPSTETQKTARQI